MASLLDVEDRGYTSRKWWGFVGVVVLAFAGYIVAKWLPAIMPLYGTLCLTMTGVYTSFAGLNVANKLVTAVGNAKLTVAGSAKPPEDIEP